MLHLCVSISVTNHVLVRDYEPDFSDECDCNGHSYTQLESCGMQPSFLIMRRPYDAFRAHGVMAVIQSTNKSDGRKPIKLSIDCLFKLKRLPFSINVILFFPDIKNVTFQLENFYFYEEAFTSKR